MIFNIIFAIYFLFCVTVILGGYFILSIYKGYLHSKNRKLDILTQSEIEQLLFMAFLLSLSVFLF
jgi:hypothetical protein